jgi:hypothetical protein
MNKANCHLQWLPGQIGKKSGQSTVTKEPRTHDPRGAKT